MSTHTQARKPALICPSVLAIVFTLLIQCIGSAGAHEREKVSIKLFDATRTFSTGPITSPEQAIPFATRSVILSKAEGDSAVLSSTPDGKGAIVIDNFLKINGKNVCRGLGGQSVSESCFGAILDPSLPIDEPIDKVLQPIAPIDVSAHIPTGTTTVLFDLRDFGAIAGNTDLYLVTTSKEIGQLKGTWDGSQLIIASSSPEQKNATLIITIRGDTLHGLIMIDGRPVLRIARQLSNGLSTTPPILKARFMPSFLGANAAFEADLFVLNGRINGRPIVPLPISPGGTMPDVSLGHGQQLPSVRVEREDLNALSAFAGSLEAQLPDVSPISPVFAGTCRDECTETACTGAKNAGFPVMFNRTTGICEGTDNQAAAEEYRQRFNECFTNRCDLLGKVIGEIENWLPHQIGRVIDAITEVTTKGRRG